MGPPTLPTCSSSLPELAFDKTTVGECSANRRITVVNTGGGVLEGTVSATATDFEVVRGRGRYTLGAGESRDVDVRFCPVGSGSRVGVVSLGTTDCNQIPLTGLGEAPAECALSESSLDLGNVVPGECSAPLQFTITNRGGDALSGEVSEACADFEVVSGGGVYTLAAGETRTVTVRFCPQGGALQSCVIETGVPGCGGVTLTGTTDQHPACRFVPGALAFGAVPVGQCSPIREFTVINTGGGQLSGAVSETCPEFEIVSGGGSFSLAAGQSRIVGVRFCPTGTGPRNCTIATGTPGCGGITASGTGDPLPVCQVAPANLGFGALPLGQCSPVQEVTITNTGGGTLAGTAFETCPDFEIVSGGGAYSLTAGQSRVVGVRFCPQTAGDLSCVLDMGAGGCTGATLTGSGDANPSCRINPGSLAFDPVTAGGCSAAKDFTITNAGAGTLAGAVSEACPDFEIVAGGGPYSLGAGQSLTVSVRFCPASAGQKSCVIETGSPDCADIACSGTAEPPPACQPVPASLAFGAVAVGECSAARQFTIVNTGGGTLTGTMSETCPDFEIVSGGGPYSLGAGQSRIVAVRFCPQGAGERTCTIETGNPDCAGVTCSGNGDPLPVCQVAPASLGFGALPLAQCSPVQELTITNAGGGTLTGTVSTPCPDFEIVSGGGAYSLAAGQSHVVGVRFCPQTAGDQSCVIQTGGKGCPGIPCTGTGDPNPACRISSGALAFDPVTAGGCSDTKDFTITNAGAGTLAGAVSEACPDFEIIAGGGPYLLSAGQSHTVSVRFCPASQGQKSCVIETGSPDCADVSCSGTAGPPPDCEIVPGALAFGTVTVGLCSPTRQFAIVNTGGGSLDGTVSEECPDFEIVAGGGPYSLGAGESRLVVVRFCPQSPGELTCTVETGNAACADVTCSGTGEPAPQCFTTPGNLAFVRTMVGECSAPQQFAIVNTGGGTLAGTVSESCPDFEIVSGGGPYSLASGQSRLVSVRFCPQTSGDRTCAVETGNSACPAVTCTGNAEPRPACQTFPTALDFGVIVEGECSTPQQLLITNSGGGTLVGTVSEACPDFEIVSGAGPYALTAGQSRAVQVRFCPQTPGDKTCAIATGNAGCAAVAASGTGDRRPVGEVVPTTFDFGVLGVGQCSESGQFAIVNNGGGTLTGSVTENCPDFVIVSGGGPYALTAGQSRAVEIRFCPQSAGLKSCTIETGNPATPDVSCTGTGEFVFLNLDFATPGEGWCYTTNHPGILQDGTLSLRECAITCFLEVSDDPQTPCTPGGRAVVQGQLVDSYFWPSQKAAGDPLEEEGVDIDPSTVEVRVTLEGYGSPAGVVRYLVATENGGCRQQVAAPAAGGCDTHVLTVPRSCIGLGSRADLRVGKVADFFGGTASFTRIRFEFVGWGPPAGVERQENCVAGTVASR